MIGEEALERVDEELGVEYGGAEDDEGGRQQPAVKSHHHHARDVQATQKSLFLGAPFHCSHMKCMMTDVKVWTAVCLSLARLPICLPLWPPSTQ